MIKKGILKAFNSGTFLASVQIVGSLHVWLDNVPTSRGIPITEMVTGRYVAVLFTTPSNFSDATLIAIWT